MARPNLRALATTSAWMSSLPPYDLIITEAMANASTESTGEFVEIYNNGSVAVDLSGLILTDGDDIDTLQAYGSSSTTLAAGEYAVVLDPDYASDYTIDSAVILLTTGDTTVGNGLTTADDITLYEDDGSTIIATFSYPQTRAMACRWRCTTSKTATRRATGGPASARRQLAGRRPASRRAATRPI